MAYPVSARFEVRIPGQSPVTTSWANATDDALIGLYGATRTALGLHLGTTGYAAKSAPAHPTIQAYGDDLYLIPDFGAGYKVKVSGSLDVSANLTAGAVTTSPRYKANGTAITSSEFALGAGWGSTASVFVAAGSCDTAGTIIVSCAGASIAANPRIIMTYKNGTFPANGGVQLVQHTDNSESSNGGPLYHVVVKASLTAPQWFMVGTPITGNTYTFSWVTISL